MTALDEPRIALVRRADVELARVLRAGSSVVRGGRLPPPHPGPREDQVPLGCAQTGTGNATTRAA